MPPRSTFVSEVHLQSLQAINSVFFYQSDPVAAVRVNELYSAPHVASHTLPARRS